MGIPLSKRKWYSITIGGKQNFYSEFNEKQAKEHIKYLNF